MRRTHPIPKDALRVGRSRTGLGLFATELLSPGMYIEYVGDIIPTKDADKKTGARYLFEINSRWTIEGSTRSNLARYVNHACKPNCESVAAGNRIFIKALTYIQPGEELTYDYGPEYVEEFITPVGCKCSSCSTHTTTTQ